MQLRRAVRVTLAIVAGLLGLALAGAAAGWVYVGTDAGRRFVADQIADAASEDGLSVAIGRLSGDPFGTFTLGDVTASDRQGTFARIDQVEVSWRPLALLRGDAIVDRVAIGRLALDRLPAPVPAKKPTPAAAPDANPLAIGFDVELRQFTAGTIHLGTPVLGAESQFRLEASAALAADGNQAHLAVDVARTDGVAGTARVKLDYAASPARFAAEADVDEPAGGQIARLLQLPGLPPVSLHLKGDGPATDWRGHLTAEASPSAAAADITVSMKDKDIAVGVRGTVRPGPLLPDAARPITGDEIAFDTSATVAPSGPIRVTQLGIDTAKLSLAGSGQYDPSGGAIAGDVKLRAKSAVTLEGGVALAGGTVDAKLTGTLARPLLAAELSLDGLAASGLKVQQLAGNLRVEPAENDRLHASGQLRLAGLDTGGAVPTGLIASDATIDFDAAGAPGAPVTLTRLALASGPLGVTVDGTLEPAGTAQGSYHLTLATLAPLAQGAGLALDGQLDLSGGLRADTANGTGQVELVGALDELHGDRKIVSALGARVPITGAVMLRPGGKMEVVGLDVALAAATLRGDGTLADQRADARLTLALPDLGRLSALAGMPLAGHGKVDITASGPLDTLGLRATARLDGLRAADTEIGALGIGVGARLGPRVAGTAKLTLTHAGKTVPGSFGFALGDKVLTVSDIAVGDNANRLTGALQISRANGTVSGVLDGKLGALAALGVPAGGAVTVAARLDAAQGQRVRLTVAASKLHVEGAEIGSARVEATVDDAFAAPRLDATARLADAYLGSGKARGPALSVTLAAHAEQRGDTIRAEVTKLDGTFGKQAFKARGPIRVEGGGARWSGAADLVVAGGGVTLKGDIHPTRLDASIALDKLPLALAALAAPDLDLAGSASGRLDISGPRAAPEGSGSLTLDGVRANDQDWPAGAAFSLNANAKLTGGRLAAEAHLRGPRQARFDVEARTPVKLALGAGGIEMSANGALEGSANLSGRLDMIDALVGLGESRVSGAVDGQIALAGTVAQPALRGSLQVTDASYESIATGTVIRDLAVKMAFDGTEAQLTELSATDGGKGRIRGTGTVRFAPAGAWPVALTVKLDNFAAIARADATVHTNGEVKLDGTVQAPRVAGRIEVVDGDIQIPDRLPQGVRPIEVVEINGGPKRPAADAEKKGTSLSQSAAIPLDIKVAIPGRVFIRGRGLDSEWAGDLAVGGTSATPRITGGLHVVRGSLSFAGRTLNLAKGQVTFNGDNPPNPDIDARAEVSVPDLTAAIVLSGKASSPSITLESTPSMPQDEILSRMLFGKSASQISAVQAAQLVASAAELSGQTSGGGIVDRIRRTLGVDVLDVEQGEGGTGGASVKAGKYIGKDTFVTVEQGTRAGSQKVGVEIGITDHLSVETDVGRDASGSAGINWKWDY